MVAHIGCLCVGGGWDVAVPSPGQALSPSPPPPPQILNPGNRPRVSAVNEECAAPQVGARRPRGRLGLSLGDPSGVGALGARWVNFLQQLALGGQGWERGAPHLFQLGLYEECLLSFSSEKLGAMGLWSPDSRPAHLGAQPERGALLRFPSAGGVTVPYCLAGRLRSRAFHNSSVGEGRDRRKHTDLPRPHLISFPTRFFAPRNFKREVLFKQIQFGRENFA